MSKYIDLCVEYLEADDWQFQREHSEASGRDYLRAGWRGKNTKLDLVLDSREEADIVMCFAYIPVQVPEERYAAIAELFCHLNWRCTVGHFDMDFTDGEIRFRQSMDVEGGELTPTMFNNMIHTVLRTADDHFAAVMRVAFGGQSAAEALKEPEEDETSSKEPVSLQ